MGAWPLRVSKCRREEVRFSGVEDLTESSTESAESSISAELDASPCVEAYSSRGDMLEERISCLEWLEDSADAFGDL